MSRVFEVSGNKVTEISCEYERKDGTCVITNNSCPCTMLTQGDKCRMTPKREEVTNER